MPSVRSTLAVVAALVYGTSVLALPLENSYDLIERDYSDVAELDNRMYDMDVEEYYVREGGATPAVATTPTPTSGGSVPHHRHKGHHRHGHKALHSHVTKEGTTSSPDTATSKLSTREPKGGKGRGRGRKGRGRKGKGRKGKGGVPAADAAGTPADPSAAEAPAAREVADEILSVREPKGGKGKGRKGKGHKGKSRKGGKGKKAATRPVEADSSAAEPPTARSFNQQGPSLPRPTARPVGPRPRPRAN